MAAHSHASDGTSWLAILLGYWWVALIFGGAVLEWIGETFNVGVGALRRRAKLRHKRRMELRRVELQIAQAKTGAVPSLLPKPGPCVHRHVAPVVSAAEELVGWLCRGCDAQLPPDWAVREEDL